MNIDFTNSIASKEALMTKVPEWNHYKFYISGNKYKPVPRVSEILDACIGKSYLQSWSASLGSTYESTRQMILNTGTYAHILIEDFLKYGNIRDENKEFDSNRPYYREQALKCYSNFVAWWNNMIEQGFKIDILAIEKPIVCKLYGGTADIIARIKDPNGLVGNYILDFKTSTSMTIDYFYQTVMYMYAMNTNDNETIKIDGVGVIRCDKYRSVYEYLIINKQKDPEFINCLRETTRSMVEYYYRRIESEYQYQLVRDKYLKDYKWV